jgi:hydrogenase maturation protease
MAKKSLPSFLYWCKKMDKKLLILGIGNYLMGDDGLGVHVINELKNRNFPENVEVVDGATKGLDLIHYLENKDFLIIIDAIDLNKNPGELIILKDEEIKNYCKIKYSVHEIGLGDLLSTALLMDILPEEIVLIGLQPENIELKTELSQKLRDNLNLIFQEIDKLLKQWKFINA